MRVRFPPLAPNEETMNAQEVLDYLCSEGWDYALRAGFDPDDVTDPDVKEACQEAVDALENLEEVLREQLGEEKYEETIDAW